MSRKIELTFAAFFAWFFIGWLTFDIPVAFDIHTKSTVWYAREIDPLFRNPPSWLKIFGWFALAYGPFYAATAYGFLRRKSWLLYVLLPLTGMMVATVLTYFAEEITGDVQPLNWTLFYVMNSPHLVVPPLAAVWLIARTKRMASA
jgi:hypothetical protein